jgi:hypothetical protein
MKRKQVEGFLYSTIGIFAVALILIAFNLIASRAKARLDLTAEKAYTLSPGDPGESRYADCLALLPNQRRERHAGPAHELRATRRRFAGRISPGVEGADRDPAPEPRA